MVAMVMMMMMLSMAVVMVTDMVAAQQRFAHNAAPAMVT
jgi:hypothetical protein